MLVFEFPSRIALRFGFDGFLRTTARQHTAALGVGAHAPFAQAVNVSAAILGEEIEAKRVAPGKHRHLVIQSGLLEFTLQRVPGPKQPEGWTPTTKLIFMDRKTIFSDGGIRQLLHRAGPERQVPNAQRCIVGGSGGSYMDAQIMMLERATR